ncbi:MAG: cyclophilin family peptidyl-prolyl cis-trans isomerase [Patiriisocius sp.]|jgi:cyclophilin family peptidyl-prolyl cis-trans isomerase
MNLKSTYLCLLLLVAIFSCNSENDQDSSSNSETKNVFTNDFLAKIHTHKDLRDSQWLNSNIDSVSAEELTHVLNAMASCKDSTSLEPILMRVIKADINESEFLIGMNAVANLATKNSAQRLIGFCETMADGKKMESVLMAIGSTGDISAHEFLLRKNISVGTMHGLYRSFLKGNNDIAVCEKAIEGLSSANKDIRYWSAHILNRQRDHDLTSYFESLKKAFDTEKEELVKIPLAGSFREVIGVAKSKFMQGQFLKETNPLVLINLIRTLDKSDFPDNYKALVALSDNPTEQVATTALGYLENNYNPVLDEDLKVLEQNTENDIVKAGLYKIFAVAKDAEAYTKTKKLFSETKNKALKGYLISVMAQDPKNKSWIFDILNNDQLPVLQGIAHQSLLDMSTDEEKKEFISQGLQSSNVALICQSAAAIRSEKIVKRDAVNWTDLMQKKTSELVLPKELEALVEMRKSIAYLSDEAVEDYKPKYNHPLDWQLIMKLPSRPVIELKTSKGVIEWELYLDKIPGAVSTIVNLIDSGYYDNKIFHRIVPNFVAQGGCPRGDGWGSLNFSLRSEYADGMDYTAGAIGLASAGENTESCQFFMCHSATPHLDDRYSVIGRVTKGLDVLCNIGLGDTIESMKRIN